jgi:hypothetical protein
LEFLPPLRTAGRAASLGAGSKRLDRSPTEPRLRIEAPARSGLDSRRKRQRGLQRIGLLPKRRLQEQFLPKRGVSRRFAFCSFDRARQPLAPDLAGKSLLKQRFDPLDGGVEACCARLRRAPSSAASFHSRERRER